MEELVPAVARAFIAYSTGRAISPQRTVLELPPGVSISMPAALPDEGMTAVKVVSVFPGNPDRGLPTIHGVVTVLEATTGRPLALLDGAYLTALRTGAASGAATEALALSNASVLALIGTGFQARFQAEAVACVRALETVRVYGRNRERRERFATDLRRYLRSRGHLMEVVAAPSAAEAVRGAQVVCTTTTSSTPVLEDVDIADGTHVNGVGSFRLDMQELPQALVRRARVVVDSREVAEAEAGDLLPAVQDGYLEWSSLPELGEVLAGSAPGRQSVREVTCFKSVGLPVQDVAAAALIARRAEELQVGTLLER
ncbi:MAG: ornithine cyclodeaminase family protein [Chloroflexota bacterium]|nr:ornithine cyclodeaminase family protein [Chloroflexota bacterium]